RCVVRGRADMGQRVAEVAAIEPLAAHRTGHEVIGLVFGLAIGALADELAAGETRAGDVAHQKICEARSPPPMILLQMSVGWLTLVWLVPPCCPVPEKTPMACASRFHGACCLMLNLSISAWSCSALLA